MLPSNQSSLEPYGKPGDFPTLEDGRQILTFAGERPALEMTWEPAQLEDGTMVEVRKAACGLGCYCGGEYRFPGEHHVGIIADIEAVLDDNEGDAFEVLARTLRFLLIMERLIPTDVLELIEERTDHFTTEDA